jgi:hypothetical protein
MDLDNLQDKENQTGTIDLSSVQCAISYRPALNHTSIIENFFQRKDVYYLVITTNPDLF